MQLRFSNCSMHFNFSLSEETLRVCVSFSASFHSYSMNSDFIKHSCFESSLVRGKTSSCPALYLSYFLYFNYFLKFFFTKHAYWLHLYTFFYCLYVAFDQVNLNSFGILGHISLSHASYTKY